jgi:hypothetical protein
MTWGKHWRCGVGTLLAAGLAGSWAGGVRAAYDSTFYSGRELGGLLLTNVVKIRSNPEHGFGLVVGAQAGYVYIVTANHVVVTNAPANPPVLGGAPIEVSFCDGDTSGAPSHLATRVTAFDPGGHDLALLRVAQPAGYVPQLRAVAPLADIKPGEESWLLGQSQKCGVLPRSGAVAALPNANGDMRIEYPGALGGESGGPAISGFGVLGLITDASDLTFTIHSIASLQARLQAQLREWWQLEPARNIPPTDPVAARVDLSETLNLYLFSVRNLQKLLLRPAVPRELFHTFAGDYNTAVNRFRLARERHDGALKVYWPDGVLAQWEVLRDQLWQVHQTFWKMNDGDSQAIFDKQGAPAAVKATMQDLEPALVQLDSGTKAFLKALTQGGTP